MGPAVLTGLAPLPARAGHVPGPVAGIDVLTPDERAAEALVALLVARLPAGGCTVATHWARAQDLPHVALSVTVPLWDAVSLWELLHDAVPGDALTRALCLGELRTGPPALVEPALLAAHEAGSGRAGRAVHFPGSLELVGTLPVREVLRRSAIDRVRVLGVGEAAPDLLLTTRDFVRPTWIDGRLVLTTQPAAGGMLVPFETPTPTPCCRDHG